MEDLKKIYESPFNWDISEQIVSDFNEENMRSEEQVSIINLIYSIMMSYVYTVKADFNNAVKNLRDTDFIWANFDHVIFCSEGISLNVILEVLLATKLNVFYAIEQYDEVNKVLSDLQRNKLNKKEIHLSTLNGCKAIAWSFFHEKGAEKAISFAKSGLKDNPNCSLWHFILGKNLRKSRRSEVWCCNPSDTEIQSLVKAYELTNNPLYGICAARSYQENSEEEIAASYYNRIFKTRPADCKIQLRLALCFLRIHDLQRAKICLDYVENCCPELEIFYHYKGIYYKKIHNYEIAVEYFQKASKGTNLGAFKDYGQCMLKVDKDFSYLFHLLNLKKKFRRANNNIIQQLLLDIAMEQYHNGSYERALKNFIEGIKLSPRSRIIQMYPSRFEARSKYNIYEFVNNNLIQKFEQRVEKISEDILNDIEDFKNILALQEEMSQNIVYDIEDFKNIAPLQKDKITSISMQLQHHSWIDIFQFYINKLIEYVWNFFL